MTQEINGLDVAATCKKIKIQLVPLVEAIIFLLDNSIPPFSNNDKEVRY